MSWSGSEVVEANPLDDQVRLILHDIGPQKTRDISGLAMKYGEY